jgi:hypothetical protein
MPAMWLQRVAALGLLGADLAGCITAAEQSAPIRPITCKAGADCDEKWSRAAAWIRSTPHGKSRRGPTKSYRPRDTIRRQPSRSPRLQPRQEITRSTSRATAIIRLGAFQRWHNRGRDSRISSSPIEAHAGTDDAHHREVTARKRAPVFLEFLSRNSPRRVGASTIGAVCHSA